MFNISGSDPTYIVRGIVKLTEFQSVIFFIIILIVIFFFGLGVLFVCFHACSCLATWVVQNNCLNTIRKV